MKEKAPKRKTYRRRCRKTLREFDGFREHDNRDSPPTPETTGLMAQVEIGEDKLTVFFQLTKQESEKRKSDYLSVDEIRRELQGLLDELVSSTFTCPVDVGSISSKDPQKE